MPSTLLLYGHLLGVGLLVAGTGGYLVAAEVLARTGGTAQRDLALRLIHLSLRGLIAGGVTLVGFGLALAVRHGLLGEPWVIAALGLIALQGVVGAVFTEAPVRRLEAPRERPPGRGGRDVGLVRAAGYAALPVLAELELLMTIKPDPGPLALSVALALLVAAALGAAAYRATPAEPARGPTGPGR